jgi:isopentenyl-diphosphate delta-isomerase
MPNVILVDENDNPVGEREKLEAHEKGLRHRCFSIFIFNDAGELMLQQREKGKYHCGGMWTNTTCSHPEPGEDTLAAAHRRLQEEMGFDCDMHEIFVFEYRTDFDNGLTEHEVDHVMYGIYNKEPAPNPEECGDWKWIKPEELLADIDKDPNIYTSWFKIALPRVLEYIKENKV